MSKGNGKLHELLAVEGDLEGQAKKILSETARTFANKAEHFIQTDKVCEMFEEGAQPAPPEHFEMVTTVLDKLTYTNGYLSKYIDALVQKESTNQVAVADLVVDGVTIGTNLPATFLLGLENRLKSWRVAYDVIPTLAPGKAWVKDDSLGRKGVFRDSHPEEKLKTAKKFQHQVLVEAQFPKEGEAGVSLPAQIEKWEEQVPVGKFVTQRWCSMMSPGEKSDILERFDKLIMPELSKPPKGLRRVMPERSGSLVLMICASDTVCTGG